MVDIFLALVAAKTSITLLIEIYIESEISCSIDRVGRQIGKFKLR